MMDLPVFLCYNYYLMRNQIAATLAVLFGSLYTISRKYQCVISLDQEGKQFNEPLLQTLIIFIGMASITLFRPLIPHEEETPSKKKQSRLIYLIPSALDVLGTISDTAGLYYTSVSVSQMLKGATLFFTYLISISIFKRVLTLRQHLWMVVILFSLGVIGYSNSSDADIKYQSRPLLGNSLVFISQLIFALMFLAEEKIAKVYNIQVKNAVMWEGIWGVMISGLLVFIFANLGTVPSSNAIEKIFKCDFYSSCSMIFTNSSLLITITITALCISPFNYFGLLITKNSSALQRCMICTSRMVLVWLVSLALNWQQFNILQFIGYLILTYAIYEYNQESKKEERIQEIKDEEMVLRQE